MLKAACDEGRKTESKNYRVSTGGLAAEYREGYVTLSFVVSDWSSVDIFDFDDEI